MAVVVNEARQDAAALGIDDVVFRGSFSGAYFHDIAAVHSHIGDGVDVIQRVEDGTIFDDEHCIPPIKNNSGPARRKTQVGPL